jgi:hypothetical protein
MSTTKKRPLSVCNMSTKKKRPLRAGNMPTMEKGPLSALETTCRTREPKQQTTIRKRKNRLVAACSREAMLEFDETTTNKSIGLPQCAGEQSHTTTTDWTPTVRRGAVTCCQHGAEYNQQSIESPGVGDSFSFSKRQQSATATHVSF